MWGDFRKTRTTWFVTLTLMSSVCGVSMTKKLSDPGVMDGVSLDNDSFARRNGRNVDMIRHTNGDTYAQRLACISSSPYPYL